jgi:GH24 family phage-related lysozyme (muramidase)
MLLGLWGVAHVAIPEINWGEFQKIIDDPEYAKSQHGLGGDEYVNAKAAFNTINSFTTGTVGGERSIISATGRPIAPSDPSASSNFDNHKALILSFEGEEYNAATGLHPVYDDAKGIKTIGFGHRLSDDEIENRSITINGETYNIAGPNNGIPDDAAYKLFEQDFQTHLEIYYGELAFGESARTHYGENNVISEFADQSLKNNWASAWGLKNINYKGGDGPVRLEVKSNGDTTVYGFNDREEVIAAGRQIFMSMPETVQASTLSLVFNAGSSGPETIRKVLAATESGNYEPLAQHWAGTTGTKLAGEEAILETRRKQEGQYMVDPEGQNPQNYGLDNTVSIDRHLAYHPTVNRLVQSQGINLNPTSTTAPVVGESTTAATFSGPPKGGDFSARSVSGFNVGRQMAQDAGLNDDDESNYLTQFLDNPVLEQYGGYGLFLDSNNLDFHIGLGSNPEAMSRAPIYATGMITPFLIPVDVNDPNKVTTMHIVDYIQQQGILNDPARVEQLFSFTNYFQTTTSFQREFDTRFERMSDPQKEEELLPAKRMLEDLARQLGIAYTDEELDEKSLFLTRGNKISDERFVREFVMADKAQKETVGDYTQLMSDVRTIKANAHNYFLNLSDEEAQLLADQRFTGEKTDAEILEEFAQRAAALYPALAKPVLERGVMPSNYFSTHKKTIEDMLERPVDMFGEFKDVLQFSDENGNPMSLSNLETKIRKSSEWQGTKNAELKARELATLIAQEFGMVKY